jgi:hypothetical protein
MAKIAIYHLRYPAFRAGRDDAGRREAAEASAIVRKGILEEINYVYNARVKINDIGKTETQLLEEAFRVTNSIHCHWIENEEVIFSAGKEQRSSSVGDIFVMGGKAYIVASFGFTELEADIAQLLADKAPVGTYDEPVKLA